MKFKHTNTYHDHDVYWNANVKGFLNITFWKVTWTKWSMFLKIAFDGFWTVRVEVKKGNESQGIHILPSHLLKIRVSYMIIM